MYRNSMQFLLTLKLLKIYHAVYHLVSNHSVDVLMNSRSFAFLLSKKIHCLKSNTRVYRSR